MTIKDTQGKTLSKAQVLAKATDVTQPAVTTYQFNDNVYETFSLPGENPTRNRESGTRMIFGIGQRATQAQIDAFFVNATVTGVTPNSGPVAGGTVVTIAGTDLEGVSGVTFNEPGRIVGSAAAVNIVTAGNLVLSINGGANITVALAAADTPATSVGKINTAVGAAATADLDGGGILRIKSATKGTGSSVTAVSGTGSVLADLKLTAGQTDAGAAPAGTALNLVSDTEVKVTTPAATYATAVDVVVTDDSGVVTLANGYTYN